MTPLISASIAIAENTSQVSPGYFCSASGSSTSRCSARGTWASQSSHPASAVAGRWIYRRWLLDALVTSTMDPRLLSRNYNYWVQSVGDDTIVVKTLFGQLRTARRLR